MRVRRVLSSVVVAACCAAGLTVAVGAPGAAAADNSAPSTYRPVLSQRILDTRAGTGAPKHAVAASGSVTLAVAGHGGVPASGVSAVVLNVTATATTRSGYLTVYPAGTTRPTASTLNFAAASTVANVVVAKLGTGGAVTLFNGSSGTSQLVADVQGYYLSGSATDPGAFTALAPARLLDTRSGTGGFHGAVPAGGAVNVQVSPGGGVPATGVSSVALNITATGGTASGHVTAYPGGTALPTASNVQYAAGQTVAGLAVVQVGGAGLVTLYNGSSGTVQLIADVQGYATSGTAAAAGAFTATAPKRLLDTRNGTGAPAGAVTGGQTVKVQALGVAGTGIPAKGVEAVVLTVTATGATANSGYVTTYPASAVRPSTSTLNYVKGRSTANLVVAPVDETGAVRLYNGSSGKVHLIVDVAGYLLAPDLTWSAAQEVDRFHSVLAKVSCPTSSFCVGVDGFGDASVYNGASWATPQNIDARRALQSVSCPTTGFCVAVDQGGRAVTRTGSSWAAPAVVSPNSLSDVSCTSASFCVAVDALGSSVEYDGSWQTPVVAVAGVALNAVSCSSPTFCAAVAANGAFLTYDGTSWTNAGTPAAGALLDTVSCTGADFCVAGGAANGTVVTYSGAGFGTPVHLGTGRTVNAVSCASSSVCVAVDSGGSGYSYNGSTWTAGTTLDGTQQFSGVSCASTTFCLAVNRKGNQVTFNGSAWSAATFVQSSNTLGSVSCVSPSFCAAVDLEGSALTFNGAAWTPPEAVAPGQSVASVSCASTSLCVAVGAGIATTYDGSNWSPTTPVDAGRRLTQVSCPTTTFCVAGDDNGQVVVFNGSTWTAPSSATGGVKQAITSLDCPTTTYCAATANGGGITTYNGASWTGLVRPAGSEQAASATWKVDCASAAFCVGNDGLGNTLTYDGSSWRVRAKVAGGVWNSISCVRTDFCVAVGAANGDSTFAFNGAMWLPTATKSPSPTTSPSVLSCPTDAFCLLANTRGYASTGIS